MKKVIVLAAALTFVVSCKNTSENKQLEERIEKLEKELSAKENTEEKEAVIAEEEVIEEVINQEEVISEVSKVVLSDSQFDQTIAKFQKCKSVSTKRSDCRNAFTQFISEKYNLNEFKNKKGGYEIYDSIQPIISKSKSWKKIGTAASQNNIDQAVAYASKGGLALVIDTSNTYGQVVLVQSGETKKSGSWGLELPQVFSLANHNPSKSFQGKSLAYAFKKSNDLQIYLRK